MASTIVRGTCFRCGRDKNLRWNHILGFALIVLAAYVIFKEW